MVAAVSASSRSACCWWLAKNLHEGQSRSRWPSASARPAASPRSAAAAFAALLRGRIDMAIALGGAAALACWRLAASRCRGFGAAHADDAGRAVARALGACWRWCSTTTPARCTGRVLAGPLRGARASTAWTRRSSPAWRDLPRVRPDGCRLLEAYLDRRFPGWRKTAQGDADAGPGAARPARGSDDPAGGLRGPWASAGRGRGRDPQRAPRADEETASRPGGLDVSRHPGKPGQGRPLEPASLNSTRVPETHARPTGRPALRRVGGGLSRPPSKRPAAGSSISRPSSRSRRSRPLQRLAGGLGVVLVEAREAGAVEGGSALAAPSR